MNFLKRTLPLIIAFVFGIMGIMLKYIPHQASDDLLQALTKWITIIFAFTKIGIVAKFMMENLLLMILIVVV